LDRPFGRVIVGPATQVICNGNPARPSWAGRVAHLQRLTVQRHSQGTNAVDVRFDREEDVDADCHTHHSLMLANSKGPLLDYLAVCSMPSKDVAHEWRAQQALWGWERHLVPMRLRGLAALRDHLSGAGGLPV
jgi:hypothetical protein